SCSSLINRTGGGTGGVKIADAPLAAPARPVYPRRTCPTGGERMKTVLVASSKGGVGKTTIATHLAANAALSGQNTVLIDADPQGSSMRWAGRRSPMESAVLALDGSRRQKSTWNTVPGD